MLTVPVLGMAMRVWMTMSSSTKTGTIAAMTRISTLMRFEQMRWCMRVGVFYGCIS